MRSSCRNLCGRDKQRVGFRVRQPDQVLKKRAILAVPLPVARAVDHDLLHEQFTLARIDARMAMLAGSATTALLLVAHGVVLSNPALFALRFVTGIATYALLIPLFLVFGISLSSLAESELAGTGVSISFMIIQYAISIGVPALYFGWMQSSNSMASLGKMAVGIKVVRTNGERLSFWRSFLRYVAMILFTLVTCGLGMLISGLMVAFTERKQGVHDMVCDTLVVDKWAFTNHPEWQQQGLGTVTIVVLSIFGLLLLVGIIAIVALIGVAASYGN